MTTTAARVLLGATPGVDIAAAVEQYEATERPAWEQYEATRRPAWEQYEATERPAREQLLAAVQADPLAAWIVEHAMPHHHDEAVAVLKELPATMDLLDDLAERSEWCGTWGDQVSAARVAGVIPTDGAS